MTAGATGSRQPVASAAAELKQRVLWGGILAVVALSAAMIGGWLLTIGVSAIVVVIAREWTNMVAPAESRQAVAVAVPSAIVVIVAGFGPIGIAVALAFLAAIAVGVWFRSTWIAGGVIYSATFGVSLVALRADASFGLEALILVLFVVWATDSAAYFIGRSLGGPKLWPAISPNKTWSGAVGGALVAVMAGLMTGWAVGVEITIALAIVILALSVVAQAGDLFESAVKRRFGVKDSGSLIPGHGGAMDRVDGLTFGAGTAALIGWLHLGSPELGGGLLIW